MRAILTGFLLCLALASQADAKGKMTLALGDASPKAGQRITVVLRMELAVDPRAVVRVAAVAPGSNMYDVISRVTAAGGGAATSQGGGFGFELTRVAPHRWREFVGFPRAGKWLLVVPNWGGAPGYAMPPPIVRQVDVSRP